MWDRYYLTLKSILLCICDGIFDSLRLPSTLIFFLSSVTVRVRVAHCLILNGVIFLGSLLIAEFLLAPLLRMILLLGGITTETAIEATMQAATSMPLASANIPLPGSDTSFGAWMNVVLLYAYQLLWLYPLYALSFILNAIWYQDIADHAFITHGGASQTKSITFQKWVATMSDEVYRLLLVSAYMIQVTLVSFIPYGIGYFLVVVHLCWLYSLYSFEYKWSLLGWSLEYRLKYFEKHWAYFLGFGLPAVLLSLVFPKFISLGIFALAFPIFIILAIIAKPTNHSKRLKGETKEKSSNTSPNKKDPSRTDSSSTKRSDKYTTSSSSHPSSTTSKAEPSSTPTTTILFPQLPIFRIATYINWWLLRQLQRRSKANSRRPSIDTSTVIPHKLNGKTVAPTAASLASQ